MEERLQKQKTIIHFVRHGEVENPKKLRYGRLPGFHLSETGRKQAEQAALFFIKRKISHIYTSPLERTQQTATLLGMAFPHVSIALDDRIMEVKTSSQFEGKPRDRGFYYPTQSSTDSESVAHILSRFSHFLEEKIIQHNGQEIIAVSHADPLGFLYSKYVYSVESAMRGQYPQYASIYSYVFEGLTLKQVWYRDDSEFQYTTATISALEEQIVL
jgi:broad specificity phosphatase PhoE